MMSNNVYRSPPTEASADQPACKSRLSRRTKRAAAVTSPPWMRKISARSESFKSKVGLMCSRTVQLYHPGGEEKTPPDKGRGAAEVGLIGLDVAVEL